MFRYKTLRTPLWCWWQKKILYGTNGLVVQSSSRIARLSFLTWSDLLIRRRTFRMSVRSRRSRRKSLSGKASHSGTRPCGSWSTRRKPLAGRSVSCRCTRRPKFWKSGSRWRSRWRRLHKKCWWCSWYGLECRRPWCTSCRPAEILGDQFSLWGLDFKVPASKLAGVDSNFLHYIYPDLKFCAELDGATHFVVRFQEPRVFFLMFPVGACCSVILTKFSRRKSTSWVLKNIHPRSRTNFTRREKR